jgi:uncharacterized RDD family membrane protein YckC
VAKRTESADTEAERAERLKGDGALTLELVGLSLEQFESVCRAVRQLDLDYAVDADGHLAVESPSAAQVDELRSSARHARRDLDRAVLSRLRSRRGSRTIAVDDLTAVERDEVVTSLAHDGHLAVVDDADLVVARRGGSTADRLIEAIFDSDGTDGTDDLGPAADRASDRSRHPSAGLGLPLAPYSKRFLGFAIDALAFLTVALVLGFVGQTVGFDPAIGLLAGVVAWFAVSAVMHARTGRTLGKTMAGTRVVDATTGGPVSMTRSTLRGLVQFLPVTLAAGGILVIVVVHGAVLILPDRQGLHDRLARTLVIEVDED